MNAAVTGSKVKHKCKKPVRNADRLLTFRKVSNLKERVLTKKCRLRTITSDQKKFCIQHKTIKVLGGGGVGEETLLQKDPSPTKAQPHHLT